MTETIVIVSGARTPFGAYGGGLSGLSATDLAVVATAGAIKRAGIDPHLVDHVVMGNVVQTSKDAIYLARHVALRTGARTAVPGLTINQLCGSGVYAVAIAGMLATSGQAEVVVSGGSDSLSMTPYLCWGVRWGSRMGHLEMWDGLDIVDTYTRLSMGETAEVLQERYKISRQEQDKFALRSQMLCKEAQDSGRLSKEIVPVEVADKKGTTRLVSRDEHPRAETSLEALGRLKPVFKSTGTVTAGNACGIVDGAAAVVVTTMQAAGKLGLPPLCRVVSWAVEGVAPDVMGIGPVVAIPSALRKAGLTLEDIDLIEINEAFAVQYLACEADLVLDRQKVNVNGGAIALGHPFAASGTRLLLTLALELQERKARYGLVSLCIGGGMGIAMIIERL